MELYRAVVKLEQDGGAGGIQVFFMTNYLLLICLPFLSPMLVLVGTC